MTNSKNIRYKILKQKEEHYLLLTILTKLNIYNLCWMLNILFRKRPDLLDAEAVGNELEQ